MNAITVDGQILELLEQGDATAAQLREQMIGARSCIAIYQAQARLLARWAELQAAELDGPAVVPVLGRTAS